MKQLRGNKADLTDRLLQHAYPEQPQITISALFPCQSSPVLLHTHRVPLPASVRLCHQPLLSDVKLCLCREQAGATAAPLRQAWQRHGATRTPTAPAQPLAADGKWEPGSLPGPHAGAAPQLQGVPEHSHRQLCPAAGTRLLLVHLAHAAERVSAGPWAAGGSPQVTGVVPVMSLHSCRHRHPPTGQAGSILPAQPCMAHWDHHWYPTPLLCWAAHCAGHSVPPPVGIWNQC